MTPEGKNVAFFRSLIKAAGGTVRKQHWEGVRGAPDLFVMLPCVHAWVEMKAEGGDLAPHQIREIRRMDAAGCITYTSYSQNDSLVIARELERLSLEAQRAANRF